MPQDGGTIEPGGLEIEGRLTSLEADVADLTAQMAALRAQVAARPEASVAAAPPRWVPGPIPPVAPYPAPPVPPVAPYPAPPAHRALLSGPPPVPAGWAAHFAPATTPGGGAQVFPPAAPAAPRESSAPRPMPVVPPAPPAGPTWSFAELEERLTGRLLAWIGGAAVLLGAILFLSLAFSRGWIGPAGRVTIGLIGAMCLFGLGTWLFERRPHQGTVATVLVGVGLAVGTLAVFGATRLYGLVPVELGLVGSLVFGVAAAVVAIRADSRTVGAFGLLAVLGAPPLLGASPGPVTFALVTTILIGTTVVALQRSWRWFPGLAFVLSAPQLATWILDGAPVGLGLVAVAAFWLIHAVASSGEELLRPTDRLRDSSAVLLVTDAAYLVWGGFVLLDGPFVVWRGPFLVSVALAHWGFAALCLVRQGDRHPFGLLVAGTGVAALTMAVPIQFHGSPVAIAWTAEATVLAWLAAKRDHLHAGLAALVLGALAAAHFVAVEDPMGALGRAPTAAVPFLDPAGMTLAFMLGGLAVAGWFLRDPRVRMALATAGTLLVTYALPFELSGLALVAGWSVLAVLAVAAERFAVVPAWPPTPSESTADLPDADELQPGLGVVGIMPALLALGHAAALELPLNDLGHVVRPAIPFTDTGAAAAAILVAMCVAIGALRSRWVARIGVLIAVGVIAYALPFELPIEWAIVGWAGLAVAGFATAGFGAARLDPTSAELARWSGLALTALGVLVALVVVIPPARLVVSGATIMGPLWAYLSIVALVAALTIGDRSGALRPIGPWPLIAAGSLLVYLASVVIVDAFASRVGGSTATEELAKQAQVALSVSWTLEGAITFAAALVRRIASARQCGLALLALATSKVFLVDLASLDVAYRVLSLVGLGLLLLGSAYAYQRLRPDRVARA